LWRVDLDNAKTSKLTNFKCSAKDCDSIKKYLTEEFSSEVITFKNEGEHVYDQPYSTRSLIGVLGYINDFTERPIDTTHMSVN
jgi:hypothetical protein